MKIKKKKPKKKKKSEISIIMNKFEMEIMSDESPSQTPYIIPFRHKGLQYITGGIPGGRFTEIIGDSLSGKSFLVYEAICEALGMGGHAMLDDPEISYEPSYGARIGIKGERKFYYTKQPILEDFFTASREFVTWVRKTDKYCPILIGGDSYPALIHKAAKKDIAEMKAGQEVKGYLDAKKNAILKILLGEFIPFMAKNKATLVFVNQGKTKIGVGKFEDPRTSNAEGTMKFYATLRLWGRANAKEKDKVTKKKIGLRSNWEAMKNRNIPPGLRTDVTILFKDGLQPLSGFGELLVDQDRVKKNVKKKDKPRLWTYQKKKYRLSRLIQKHPEVLVHPGWGE